MSEWQSIETAPKDGTVIRGRNSQIQHWKTPYVEVRWGTHTSQFTGGKTKQWVVVRDFEKFMPMRPGTLVCPDEWQPINDSKDQKTHQ
jgi:hypothetical protein